MDAAELSLQTEIESREAVTLWPQHDELIAELQLAFPGVGLWVALDRDVDGVHPAWFRVSRIPLEREPEIRAFVQEVIHRRGWHLTLIDV